MIRFRRAYLPTATLSVAVALLVIGLLFGGASRIDVLPPLVARVAGLAAIAFVIWAAVPETLEADRIAKIIWVGIFAIPIIQMIPLPWTIWTNLPGHSLARDVQLSLGLMPWHGITLTPDRTLNGLLALLPAFAAWLVGRRLDESGRSRIVAVIAAMAVFSAAIGLFQRAAGSSSGLYFYSITNNDSSVGIFSNANHHSLFLCCGIVALLFWLAEQARGRRNLPPGASAIVFIGLLMLLSSIIATNSRAGVLLAPFALLAGLAMQPWQALGIGPITLRIGGGAVLAFCLAVIALIFGGAFGNFGLSNTILGDGRLDNLPLFGRIIADQFPTGSGMGSFDPVFRGYERASTLSLSYLNNAHNDYAQIAIEAGLAGIGLLLLFCLWLLRHVVQQLKNALPQRCNDRLQWGSVTMIGLLMAHSAVDYPLRTAALSVVFAFCCAFLAPPAAGAGRAA